MQQFRESFLDAEVTLQFHSSFEVLRNGMVRREHFTSWTTNNNYETSIVFKIQWDIGQNCKNFAPYTYFRPLFMCYPLNAVKAHGSMSCCMTWSHVLTALEWKINIPTMFHWSMGIFTFYKSADLDIITVL